MMILQGFVFRCAGCQARRLSTSETRRIFSSYSVGLQARRILKLDACMVIRQHKYHRQVVVMKEKNIFEEYDNEEIPKQKEIKIRNNEKFDKFVADSAKLRQNLLTSKVLIMIFAFCMVGYIFIYTLQEDTVNDDQPKVANEWMVTLYRKMPLNSLSRAWGKMMTWELPLTLREPLLGLYVWLFNVQLHEAEDCNLKNYRNLQEFFRRQLKPNARIVDQQSPVTSPADGTILHFGKVENGIVEQVKGVNYSIKGFLGPHRGDEDSSKPVKDCHYHQKMNLKPGNELHHCIIYLAPGDYHRFHSPCDWKIASRRHFPGELLSVNPGIARWVQGLFNMNERVVYSGTWEHGFFSYTAVGATNVGSIKIYFDENLETNTKRSPSTCTYHDEVFTENISMKKGDMIGEFNLGSTIVLLFEAPKNFKFNINPGQKVQYGQSIGGFEV